MRVGPKQHYAAARQAACLSSNLTSKDFELVCAELLWTWTNQERGRWLPLDWARAAQHVASCVLFMKNRLKVEAGGIDEVMFYLLGPDNPDDPEENIPFR